MEQLLPYISEVGFPIIVTLYLLHRIEAKLLMLNESIQRLPLELREELAIVKRPV
ncbi:YvrJ family protein [Bacillus suaedaesalsae]|uniref:YvrJ family protein n=1 Tax=Bacillus suaedaesalsae TaxID=2810349 RepID=A0ABS2DDI0_9BACI|nr:YvrJ family protein [Bacillus suaedaesalsae]MBM6616521.1 YvrJ family protein [Bacillus suaedaesalsae]